MLTMYYTKKIEEAQTVQEQYHCAFIWDYHHITSYNRREIPIFVFRKANVNRFREVLGKVTMEGMLGHTMCKRVGSVLQINHNYTHSNEKKKNGRHHKKCSGCTRRFWINIFKSMKGRLVLYDKVDMAGTMSLNYNEVGFNWTTGKIS